ncbi:hypothetical protein G6F36_010725 [Rhizopus arrhizus]|nr:hypothetical protein G6F36_010725 [Rhizopus arrhizus]
MVGGRLSLFASEWTTLSINDWLLNTIRTGFQLHFHTQPPLSHRPRPIAPFNQSQDQLLSSEIHQLLSKGAIESVNPQDPSPGFYSSMFVIPKRNGGHRPVFNLKNLNQYLTAPHFKMETIQDVTRMLKANDWLTSIDLSDAFLHIPVDPTSRRYLRFHWKGQSYQFCTTPFGLSLVPWLFTKITRPILEWARSLNIRISAYLDDWIIVADSPEQSIHHTNVVLQKLRCLGWLGNLKKSILTPCQTLEHLGFSLNTIEMTAHLPGKKLRDIRRSIQQILKKPVQSPRTIHSLTMRIQAATFAILPARMYTQYLLRLKNQTVKTMKDWDLPQPLTPECLKELNWWKTNIGLCNGRNILPQTPQETIFVDASNSGWGCSISPDPQTSLKTAHGTQGSADSSSTASKPTEQDGINQNGQYDVNGVHEQTRRDSVVRSGGTGNNSLEMVSSTRDIDHSATHSRGAEPDSRLRVSSHVHQELLANQASCVPSNHSTEVGPILSGGSSQRRIQCPMVPVVQPIYPPTMEPCSSMSREDSPRTAAPGDNGDTILDLGDVVPSPAQYEPLGTDSAGPDGNSMHNPFDSVALDRSQWEAVRVETLRCRFQGNGLNESSAAILSSNLLLDNATNRSYQHGQYLFIQWASFHQISLRLFSPTDVINFLADLHRYKQYPVGTLRLARSAITHFHENPLLIRSNVDISSFLNTLTSQAPPVRLHKPTIDLLPTFQGLRKIISAATTPFPDLQRKLAFLLALTCFLRPSDLARIPYSSVTLDPSQSFMTFDVVAPKERRKRRRIIKTFKVKAHTDQAFCPVQVLLALQHHGFSSNRACDSFFIHSLKPNKSVCSSTIGSWLKEFLALSSCESHISVRSVASSLALRLGIPEDDVITMGNWASSSTFEHHYRREHLSNFGFTNTLLPADEDIFFDAEDNLQSLD